MGKKGIYFFFSLAGDSLSTVSVLELIIKRLIKSNFQSCFRSEKCSTQAKISKTKQKKTLSLQIIFTVYHPNCVLQTLTQAFWNHQNKQLGLLNKIICLYEYALLRQIDMYVCTSPSFCAKHAVEAQDSNCMNQ